MRESSFHTSFILVCSGEVKLVTETKYRSNQKLKVLTPGSVELQHVWDWEKKKKKAAVERSSWRWPPVWLPHRWLLPCLQGKQDSARVQCFMSWSQPNSPHSHKHCTKGRDSGHAAVAAKPQEACALCIIAHTHIYIFPYTCTFQTLAERLKRNNDSSGSWSTAFSHTIF